MHDNKERMHHEVRQLYKHLRARYKPDVIIEFLRVNYFISKDAVYTIISKKDEGTSEPSKSIQYKKAMSVKFKL